MVSSVALAEEDSVALVPRYGWQAIIFRSEADASSSAHRFCAMDGVLRSFSGGGL